ncbi:DUF421 domain-containing protein [Devosia nitrariae]|uniref:DUF421 domain-containing protein n=1 Tax=Devosia nitrariae TaxID=2071872 RepID=A0ABQ5W8R6_9HYPH|nr:YetF domain-containing protein [Devosia nitrariae]GLQ56189.1 DUF421 domain-containing protein [Devosia nitrariae]
MPTDELETLLAQAIGDPATILSTAIRVAVVFVIILWLLKASGKRVLGQFTPFDLVALLLISNVVQNAMLGPDMSVIGGLLGAAVILALNRLVSSDDRLRHYLEGSPTVLVENGRLLDENLKLERVSAEEMASALREHGVSSIDEVTSAVLEIDGTISVCQKGLPSVKKLRTVRSTRNR